MKSQRAERTGLSMSTTQISQDRVVPDSSVLNCVSPRVGKRGIILSLNQEPLTNVITPECCNTILEMETNQRRSIDLVIKVSDTQNQVTSLGEGNSQGNWGLTSQQPELSCTPPNPQPYRSSETVCWTSLMQEREKRFRGFLNLRNGLVVEMENTINRIICSFLSLNHAYQFLGR